MSEDVDNLSDTPGSCAPSCGCNAPTPVSLSRRDFIAAGATAATLLAAGESLRAIAGPFAATQPDEFSIPADKKFTAAWLRSLTERGEPAVYRSKRHELDYIGMPIGGICAGQVYLGGDGRLWHWDIFNLPQPAEFCSSAGPHYAKPAKPASPMEQGFAIQVKTADTTLTRRLDTGGFRDVSFRGQYPIDFVEYRDADVPVAVSLEAFSPFIPLDADDSGLPATIMQFSVRNTGDAPLDVTVCGWLEHAICRSHGKGRVLQRANVKRIKGAVLAELSAAMPPPPATNEAQTGRPDILFEDFEKPTYEGWTVAGEAFGPGPMERKMMPAYQGDINQHGERLVNTHNSRNGADVVKADTFIGTLTSTAFTIGRDFIRFRIDGGNHPGLTCMNLLIDRIPVRTATGHNSNRMRLDHFDVRQYAGRTAQLQIVDGVSGGWGQIGIDEIVFTDSPEADPFVLENQPDYGTMAIAALGDDQATGGVVTELAGALPEFAFGDQGKMDFLTSPKSTPPYGIVSKRATITPGQSATFTFLIAWHFDALQYDALGFIPEIRTLRRHYGTRYKSAADVIGRIVRDFDQLAGRTRLWHKTWYDSTLPHWLLNRTLVNISTLATATCLRFNNGRFYAWEGTHCCAGTCTHVWQYAQAVARLFPSLERSTREMVDFGLAFHEDSGLIDYRAEAARELAIDGQCGTILRAYREHTMCTDDAFLKRIWPRVKKAIEFVVGRDTNADGILDGSQYNTLDATWYGQIAWISSLYLAALRAGVAMAEEMGDHEFAERCRKLAGRGSENMVKRLFNGEFFIHEVDPKHRESNSTGGGCHADQLLGQSWAHQVAVGRVVPLEQSRLALRSIYRYNFAPDIRLYRDPFDKIIKNGRWYAMPGEGGLILCTWPRGGIESAAGTGGEAWAAGYFNETWTGFEYPVASHMLWEGLVTEGLAITRMIDDRYHAAKRNPYNEVECSDHYARAMASYGTFLAACGFEYHGPKGHIGFAPRVSPENFRAAFTAAEGWGMFEQSRTNEAQVAKLSVRHGAVALRTCALEIPADRQVAAVELSLGDKEIEAEHHEDGGRVTITPASPVTIRAEQRLSVTIRLRA